MADGSGTATFLFTDIEGSTRLLKHLRDAYGEVLAEHRRLLRAAFEGHGGREIDTQGDALFFAFGKARDAVLAAVAGQRALEEHEWPEGARVRVRIGIHTGEAAQTDGRYHGVAVHRGARICAAAHGGQILVSETTRNLIEDEEEALPGVQLRGLGEHRLKDLDRAVRLFQAVAPDLPGEFPPIRTAEPPGRPSRRRRLALALAALALAGGAAGATVALTGGGPPRIAVPVPPNSLVEIDPETNAPVRVVAVGRLPGPVVATGDAVWVVNDGDRTLTRYDPEADRAITVGGVQFAADIAPDGQGGIWVTTGGPEVLHVSAAAEIVPEDTVQVPGASTSGIALGDGALWVTSPSDDTVSGRNTTTQISLKTKQPVRTYVVGDLPLFVVYGAGSAWVSNFDGPSVSVITPDLPVRTIDLGGPTGLAVGGSALWVGSFDEGKITKIDGASLNAEAILRGGRGPAAVAADAEAVWVANRDDGTVTRIDALEGRVVATVALGNSPHNVAIG